ncbi:hypothetical protein BN1708_003306 [Verticillium longisporum]|uniref:AAA+ ATPase domain-containing protein n=4 Tax=Verticillium TaxID=1036719 RepID=A0A0G4LDC7_VERLO|nr:hypothetical protein BN1708_003306 [Verticillium longisporum]
MNFEQTTMATATDQQAAPTRAESPSPEIDPTPAIGAYPELSRCLSTASDLSHGSGTEFAPRDSLGSMGSDAFSRQSSASYGRRSDVSFASSRHSSYSVDSRASRRRGYMRPQGTAFAASAQSRESVMSLGSIAHVQHFFARTGLLDGKGGQLQRKNRKLRGTLDLSSLDAANLSLPLFASDSDSSYASMGSSPDLAASGFTAGPMVESPIDDEYYSDESEDSDPNMLPPTASTYINREKPVPKPPSIAELKSSLTSSLEKAAASLKEARARQDSAEEQEHPFAETPTIEIRNPAGGHTRQKSSKTHGHLQTVMSSEEERQQALDAYRSELLKSRELETKLKDLRLEIRELQKEFDRTEDSIKALQSVGQIIGEVLKQLPDERFIVKASSGPRYVVGCRTKLDKEKLKQGTRVALDMTTLTIMRMLPREVDPLVYNMSLEDPGQVNFAGIGGLNDQIRELREVIELPLKNPELFLRVGIKPPKGVLLYGPPGTGKTLLARAVASSLETNFLKIVSSAIVDKYIGESARLIREMFGYAKEHEPCIIFMDEIDAIGGRRFSEGTSADREIQRTLMELLNQLDGFDYLGKTKIIMATNRPDTLDPALLRAGRLDRKIEIPLPNEVGRLEILKIHAAGVITDGEIDFESVVKMSDGLNGADLRNVVTEAGLFAIKDYRDAISQDDFNKAVRKVAESKKLEGKLEYQKL